MVRGRKRTDSAMPATSSITMMPGSFWPTARSTRPPDQMPSKVTASVVQTSAMGVNGMSHSRTRATALPTVPEATGA